MRKTLFISVSLVVLLLLSSCGKSYEERQRLSAAERAERARQDSLALKIATVPTLDCLPLFIGVEDSLFQKGGVDVRLRLRNSQIDGDTLLFGRHVEGAVTDLVRAERLRRRGCDLRYVTATNAYWQVIANRTARLTKPSQLSDKMIAITRFSATDLLADRCITKAKPKYDVFRIQVNDVHVRLHMLLNNEMDAMLLTEPQATTARLYKNNVLYDSRDQDLNLGVVAFREKALTDKRRQEQLKKFVKIYNNVCDSINRRGLGHYASVIKKYTKADDKTVKALPKLTFTHVAPPRAKDVEVARRY
ncbi:MAG: ABC transporter substrate-binding protein [Prevotella sp.]